MEQNSFTYFKDSGNKALRSVINDEGKIKPANKIEWAEHAISLYMQALNIPQISQSQKASLHKNLSKAYEVLEGLLDDDDNEEDFGRGMQLYYFDQGIDHANKAIYLGLGHMEAAWISGIAERGQHNYQRLKRILRGTTIQERSDYAEKIYNLLNKENADLLMRISWLLAKDYFKRAVVRMEDSKKKEELFTANSLIKKAS